MFFFQFYVILTKFQGYIFSTLDSIPAKDWLNYGLEPFELLNVYLHEPITIWKTDMRWFLGKTLKKNNPIADKICLRFPLPLGPNPDILSGLLNFGTWFPPPPQKKVCVAL